VPPTVTITAKAMNASVWSQPQLVRAAYACAVPCACACSVSSVDKHLLWCGACSPCVSGASTADHTDQELTFTWSEEVTRFGAEDVDILRYLPAPPLPPSSALGSGPTPASVNVGQRYCAWPRDGVLTQLYTTATALPATAGFRCLGVTIECQSHALCEALLLGHYCPYWV
jgi:hypothetical protein